ncbi:MAG: ABC transporter ATP-binding protein [Proteobacteria bacterium]|nr:ABC transporter ATP-binding protein [Pseudomonadota bacterium]
MDHIQAHEHGVHFHGPESADPAIRLDNVTVAYQRHPAIHHLGGSFAKGSLTALVGPNGAGKSTLLKAIVGLLPLSGGHIGVAARDKLAFLPQVTDVDRSFPMSVREVVDLGHWRKIGAFGRLSKEMREASSAALRQVGLAGFDARPIASLSVGQFQRVLFARLIAADASLILLDEPFNAVDQRTIADLMALIESWHHEERTVVAALHDLDFVRRHFPHCLLLAREPVAWGDSRAVLTPENLAKARFAAEGWTAPAEICAA